MIPLNSPSEACGRVTRQAFGSQFRNIDRLKQLALAAGLAGVALAFSSCAGSAYSAGDFVNASGGIAVSSTSTLESTPLSERNSHSIPMTGDSSSLYKNLGPNYFGRLLRDLPKVD